MGIDTRFFGPSAWQLFHLIAETTDNPREFLGYIGEVLPCKFCRASTTEFVAKHPVRKPYGKWMYEIHCMVNDKLRTQCAEDPSVVNPGPDPPYEEVREKYTKMKPNAIPGRDFLMAVAYNYDGKTPEVQHKFVGLLKEVFPFPGMRKAFQGATEPELESQKTYTKWMYGVLKKMSPTPLRSYRGYMAHLAYYKSGCDKKSYKGKTCRKVVVGGLSGYTKNRDHLKTRRVTSRSLLL